MYRRAVSVEWCLQFTYHNPCFAPPRLDFFTPFTTFILSRTCHTLVKLLYGTVYAAAGSVHLPQNGERRQRQGGRLWKTSEALVTGNNMLPFCSFLQKAGPKKARMHWMSQAAITPRFLSQLALFRATTFSRTGTRFTKYLTIYRKIILYFS